NGVLHHTGDPRGGFESILRCLKPGGFIVIGLYNTYGRLTTDFRRLVFRLTGDRLTFLDPRLRRVALNEARRRAWFMDQYKHPHESKHTYDEVLRWFDESGVEFVKSIPKCVATERFSPTEELFVASARGTAADRLLVLLFIFYFIVLAPFALLMRAFSDPLRLRAGLSPTWLERAAPDQDMSRLARRQF